MFDAFKLADCIPNVSRPIPTGTIQVGLAALIRQLLYDLLRDMNVEIGCRISLNTCDTVPEKHILRFDTTNLPS